MSMICVMNSSADTGTTASHGFK